MPRECKASICAEGVEGEVPWGGKAEVGVLCPGGTHSNAGDGQLLHVEQSEVVHVEEVLRGAKWWQGIVQNSKGGSPDKLCVLKERQRCTDGRDVSLRLPRTDNILPFWTIPPRRHPKWGVGRGDRAVLGPAWGSSCRRPSCCQ